MDCSDENRAVEFVPIDDRLLILVEFDLAPKFEFDFTGGSGSLFSFE